MIFMNLTLWCFAAVFLTVIDFRSQIFPIYVIYLLFTRSIFPISRSLCLLVAFLTCIWNLKYSTKWCRLQRMSLRLKKYYFVSQWCILNIITHHFGLFYWNVWSIIPESEKYSCYSKSIIRWMSGFCRFILQVIDITF